jgi:hypothetical protein
MNRPVHLLFALSLVVIAPAACDDDNNDNTTDGSVSFDSAAGGTGGTAGSGGTGAGGIAGSGGSGTGGAAGIDAGAGGAAAGDAGTADAGDAGATDGGDAAPAPTFTQVYTQVIAVRCMPCHTTPTGGGVVNGKLDMSTQALAFTNLVNVPAAGVACNTKGTRVTPGNPDTSVLYLKVSLDDPSPCGNKMPLNQPALTEEQADMIENWIASGAPNN